MARKAAPVLKIFDGHNDVLLALYMPDFDNGGRARSFFTASDTGHLDLPRAQKAGFAGGFFAVWVTPDPTSRKPELTKPANDDSSPATLPPEIDYSFAVRMAMAEAGTLFRLEEESRGRLKVVRNVAELRTCLDTGVMAAILHFEGAEMIDPQLNSLEVFYRAGLRSLGPAWSRRNAFGEGVPFAFPSSPDTGPGLTPRGKDLIRRCNELGIMIDLSHLNEKGFWEIAELSNAPLVASHSCAHALCASTRNLTDRQIEAIGESGGMIGLNFQVSFLREDGEVNADTPLEVPVRHIQHMVEIAGIDCVGLGSDYDYIVAPKAIKTAAELPNLVEALRDAGFNGKDLEKLLYKNWIRVLQETWGE